MKNRVNKKPIPKVAELETELKRVKNKERLKFFIKNTIYVLIVVAALAVIVAVFFMPVFRIYGSSMEPTLKPGELVVSVKTDNIKPGDIVGVYYGSKILVKRVIATENQWIDIDEDGNVYIDGSKTPLSEPYLSKKVSGTFDIKFPYQVPAHSIFIMGDNRETSVDSRNSSIGGIDIDEVAGKILFRVWPLKKIDWLN